MARQENLMKSKSEPIIYFIVKCFFSLYSITLIYPFIWVFLNSLKTPAEFMQNSVNLPGAMKFSNYISAFTLLKFADYNFLEMFANSIFLTLLATALSVGMSSISAYVIAKYEFPLQKFLYMMAIILMMIPTVGSLAPMLSLTQTLGIRDNLVGISILYAGGFGFSFLLLYGGFKSVSWTYAEAAFIDGAGDFRTFWQVMLPQLGGILTSVIILQIIAIWNDYYTVYLFAPAKPTLALGLYLMEPYIQQGLRYPIYFAGILISVIPVLIIFIIFQNMLMNNTSIGGIKE